MKLYYKMKINVVGSHLLLKENHKWWQMIFKEIIPMQAIQAIIAAALMETIKILILIQLIMVGAAFRMEIYQKVPLFLR